jgi:nitroimidazol reductase NimA-like FMN-containing flavoprotein (pyridoxamine 5'-phosphate oxidase superfamily)
VPSSEKAKEIIAKIAYITVASISEKGEPWNAPVFTAYDENSNFYWGTYRNSQKSQNIRANKNVFLVIYDSTVVPGSGEGVYIKANATELEDPKEIAFAHKLLWDRHVVPYWKLEQVQGSAPIRLYKATPEKVWMNGGGKVDGNYIDTRIEVDLSK